MLASSITCSQAPPPQLLSHIVVHTCACNAVRVIQVGGGALLAQGHAQASTCVPAGMLLIRSGQGWFVQTDQTAINQPLHGTVYLLASQQVSGICTCNYLHGLSNTELEAMAAQQPVHKKTHMSLSEAQFLVALVRDHGTDYKVCI